jgi:lysophospholipase L1-like esterase
MNIKITILSFGVAFIYLLLLIKIMKMSPVKGQIKPSEIQETVEETDSLIDVDGKKIFFIGDSHTANKSYGWQKILCEKTGAREFNFAVKGKPTGWMLSQVESNLDSTYEFCFIWGGGNDMSMGIKREKVIENLRKITEICKSNGVVPIILTGIEVRVCVEEGKRPKYVEDCEKLQSDIQNSFNGIKVIKNHFVSRKDGDCGDLICHMNKRGHSKMADGILESVKFKIK